MSNLRVSFLLALLVYGMFIALFVVSYTLLEQLSKPKPQKTEINLDTLNFKPKPKTLKKKVPKPKPIHTKKVSKQNDVLAKKQAKKVTIKKAAPKPPSKIKPKQPVPKKTIQQSLPKPQTVHKPPVSIDKKAPQMPKDVLTSAIMNSLPKPAPRVKKLTPKEKLIRDVYGEDFDSFTHDQKVFIKENLLSMQGITQDTLNRIGQLYLDPRFRYYNYNLVQFTLHPDGSISNLHMKKNAGFELLDKITYETIETAYKDYPRPKEPTVVRFKFLYDLRGY